MIKDNLFKWILRKNNNKNINNTQNNKKNINIMI